MNPSQERDLSGWNVFVGRCVPSPSRARLSDQVIGGRTAVSLGPPGSPSCAPCSARPLRQPRCGVAARGLEQWCGGGDWRSDGRGRAPGREATSVHSWEAAESGVFPRFFCFCKAMSREVIFGYIGSGCLHWGVRGRQ